MSDTTTISPPRFSVFELAYLLAGRDDAHAARTRTLTGIPEVPDTADVAYQAGLAGLIARGYLESDGDAGVVPRNEAGVVALTLGTASQWISLSARTGDSVDMSMLVQGERAAFLIRQGPGNTFDFVLIRPGEAIASVAATLVTEILDKVGEAAVMVRSASVDDEAAVLAIRSDEHGWQIGRDPVFPGDAEWPSADLVPEQSSRDAVIAALHEVVDKHRPAE